MINNLFMMMDDPLANDWARWFLWTLIWILAFDSYVHLSTRPVDHSQAILTFFTGAVVLRGLRPKPQPKETEYEQTNNQR